MGFNCRRNKKTRKKTPFHWPIRRIAKIAKKKHLKTPNQRLFQYSRGCNWVCFSKTNRGSSIFWTRRESCFAVGYYKTILVPNFSEERQWSIREWFFGTDIAIEVKDCHSRLKDGIRVGSRGSSPEWRSFRTSFERNAREWAEITNTSQWYKNLQKNHVYQRCRKD